MIENPLSYILIRPNVINEIGLKEIKEYMDSSPTEDLPVFDSEKSNKTGNTEWVVNKEIRNTQSVNISPIFPKIEKLMKDIVREIINPFYDIEVSQSEVPQLLSYGIGGHYKPHVDSEGLWKTPDGNLIWKKTTDRDLSIVLFINDDYEGGDFVFPDLKVRIRPESGMLIVFPSNHHYKHGVEPVTKGKRYSMVCWMEVKGFPTMKDINRELSQKYDLNINN